MAWARQLPRRNRQTYRDPSPWHLIAGELHDEALYQAVPVVRLLLLWDAMFAG